MNNIASNEDVSGTSTVICRPFNHNLDSAFVFASWRNSIWFDEPRDESSDKFFAMQSKYIKRLLAKPDSRVFIACLSDDPSFIVGYSVISGSNLQWVYVKKDYRKKGIAKLITKNFTTVAKPPTKIGKSIVSNKKLEVKDNEDAK